MFTHNAFIFGETAERESWTAEEIENICRRAAGKRESAAKVPHDYIVSALDGAGKMFARGGRYFAAAAELLKGQISFSVPVIEKSLEVIPRVFSRETVEKRMSMELFVPYALESAIERRGYDGMLRAFPRGVVLHVGAGNVFLGVLDSLMLGLLTKNVNIVKTSSSGGNFTCLFMEALMENDPEGLLIRNVAVLPWKGGDAVTEETVLKHVDAVFVWGGSAAVRSYRSAAPEGVRVVGFGPKTSCGIVFESAADSLGMKEIARRAALDASLWDQAACASLHTLYIVAPEERHKELAESFLREAGAEFAALAEELPQGRLTQDEQAEITKARLLARTDAVLGDGKYVSSFPATDWTVIYEKDPVYRVSPLNRVLYVKTASGMAEVKKQLLPLRGYIETVGVAGSLERREVLETLAPAGIARVAELGKMLEEAVGSPHDGIFPMMSLVDWIPLEEPPSQLERLREVTEYAAENSVFYRERLGRSAKIKSMKDFAALPFLVKDDILGNTPPESTDMLTSKKIMRGVYFASGGSTGQPKYIFYDQHEYERTCRLLAKTYEAAGLDETDVIANLFVAGNLWSSWLSVEKAIAYTKAVSVPVGSNLPMGAIFGYLKDFKVTALIGLPSFLIKLTEYVKNSGAAGSLRVKKIFYGGEYVGADMIKFFGSVFPGVAVRSGGYATSEAGAIGYQCPFCVKSEHHLFSAEQYIEFIDPETGRPVPFGDPGELVVTCLNKKNMPVIRYRVGDLGRFIKEPCPCGRKDPRFELLGRCDDRIHAGGAHIFTGDLREALGKVAGLSFNFQVIISKDGPSDVLSLSAETLNPVSQGEAAVLKDKLREQIKIHCVDLAESVRLGWLEEPEIKILPPDGIERISRTGKIRQIIDRR